MGASLFGLNHSCQRFRVLTGIDRYMMKMGGVIVAFEAQRLVSRSLSHWMDLDVWAVLEPQLQ